MNILRVDCHQDGFGESLARLRQKLSPTGDIVSPRGRELTQKIFGEPLTPVQVVDRICRDVRSKGIQAVLEYSAKIDNAEFTPETLRVPQDELASSHSEADPEFLATVRRVRENVLRFQGAILQEDCRVDLTTGSYLAQRYVPLRRVGICVPGGAAAYPSTVLMTAVPAQAAGVSELAVVAPPTDFGSYNRDLLATCHEIGITEVYRLGGAQAIAALAYGVQGIERVDKIVGPGNMFVALAKKHVFGEVDIDSIAGPSEVVVIADKSTSPEYVAADMLAQAEHSPGASILITWSQNLLDQIVDVLQRQMAKLSRGDLARSSLEQFGALVLVRNADEAAQVTNQIAPEHLHIAIKDAEALMEKITSAGAIFLGQYSPVALGDYVAGPSHVLPTSGTARFSSGLTSNDFVRGHSVICYSRDLLARDAPDVKVLANKEGLTAHWESVKIRLGDGADL